MVSCPAVFILFLVVWTTVNGDSSQDGVDEIDISECEPIIEFDVQTLTKDMFQEKMRQGHAIVVRRAALQWPALAAWNLEYLQEKFGDEVQNRPIFENEAIFDEAGHFVGRYEDGDWDSQEEDADDGNIAWMIQNSSTSKAVREYTRPLSFMDAIPIGNETRPREMVFFAKNCGDGRELHIDYSCSNVLSVQVQGSKTWTLRSPTDCQGYLALETESYEPDCQNLPCQNTVLKPGDVIYWFAGWTHGTSCLDSPCLALSMEFDDPVPKKMIENAKHLFRKHNRLFNSYTHCYEFQ